MARNIHESSSPLPPELLRFAVALLAFVLLCGVVEICCKRLFHLDIDPYNYPFLIDHYLAYPFGLVEFPDFVAFVDRFRYFHSINFFTYTAPNPFMYPAPVAVIYKIFYLIPSHQIYFFIAFMVTSFTISGVLFGQALRQRGTASWLAFSFPLVVLLCSFPIWFEFKQANMEIIIWILVTSGIALFLADRGYSAAACFGLAASMKIYPIAYLGLLLVRRQYRQIAFGVAVVAVTTLACLWLVCPSIPVAWHEINKGVDTFRLLYVLHRRGELGYDHSLFSISKLMMRKFPAPEIVAPFLSGYLLFVTVAGIALFFLRVCRLPVINQILFLTVATIWFPPVSFEYTLLHLLAPLALLVLLSVTAAGRNERVPGLNTSLSCFVILLAALPELIANHHRVGGQLKAIVLGVLFFVAVRYPFVSSNDVYMAERLEANHLFE